MSRRFVACVGIALAMASMVMAADQELIKAPPEKAVPIPEEMAGDAVGFRIRLGLKDTEPTDWSGEVKVSAGKVLSIRGWRWAAGDSAKGSTWTTATRRQAAQNAAQQARQAANQRLPMQDTGVVITFSDIKPDSKVEITTKVGKVEFAISEVPFGMRRAALDGKIEIERTPAVIAGAQSAADEDYPAAAMAKDGTVYVTYLAFSRGKDFQGVRERVQWQGNGPVNPSQGGPVKKIEKPEDFEYLREPVGGERLMLRAYKDGKWAAPVTIVDWNGVEMYRPAIAIDGSGKVWCIYSAHLNADKTLDYGDWELLARTFDAASGKVGEPVNISNAPGTDFMPVATTDSAGQVWVAWVGARGEHFNVFASHQTGNGFTKPVRLTKSMANEWEPAIAADKNGAVAVAWDTYEKGDYDVYLAQGTAEKGFGEPVAVAATLNFEGRPSMAYDNSGKLWVAWEQGAELWGKDFGALKKKGNPLYQGNRSVGVKVLDKYGQWFTPPDPAQAAAKSSAAAAAVPGRAGARAGRGPEGLGAAARAQAGVAPCYPRLAADDQGRVWMVYRGRVGGNWRVGVGSVWFEFVSRLEGDSWTPAAWVPLSNNILDNRPAVVTGADRALMVFFSGDGRGEILPARVADPHVDAGAPAGAPADAGGVVGAGGNQARRAAGGGPDPNNDIYLAVLRPESGPAPAPRLNPAAAATPAKPGEDVDEERTALKVARDYRVNLNGETLQVWRGEFHRHTEYSPDGGGDGGLLDMWRYAIDAASMDWIGDGDHDYGNGREYSWWTTQKAVTLFTIPTKFVPMYCYERSVVYPEGHRNCMFAYRGVRTLPRLPLSAENSDKPAPDTSMLYQYLHYFGALCASHTSATGMGTDWRNNDPEVEPFVEIYQGDRNNYERPDAPRSAPREAKMKQSTPEAESFGGWKPKGFVNLALLKGYRLAFESSSDHISTHLSYCSVYVTEPTRQGVIDAIRKRRVYGATDNIVADVRCKVGGKEHFMGEEFSTKEAPTLNIHIIGTHPLMNITIIKDDEVVFETDPKKQDVTMSWTDPKPTPGKTCYYYVRGEQVSDFQGSTGEIVWASPMWIKYEK